MMQISKITLRTLFDLHRTSHIRLSYLFNVIVCLILMLLATRGVAFPYLHQYHPHILLSPTKVLFWTSNLLRSKSYLLLLNEDDVTKISWLYAFRYSELFQNAARQIHQIWHWEGNLYLVGRSWYVELPSTTNLMRSPKREKIICKF